MSLDGERMMRMGGRGCVLMLGCEGEEDNLKC